MNPGFHGTAIFLTVFAVFLAACGDGDAADGSLEDRVSGEATGDIVYIDRQTMPDEPCHAVDNTIQGACSDADIDALVREMGLVRVDREQMADAPCHMMSGAIMGDCTEEDIDRLTQEMLIFAELKPMSDEPCRVEEDRIIGDCTPADVGRMAEGIRQNR